jgi:hypothetical protein
MDTQVTINTIVQGFLELYPEDAPKWLTYVDSAGDGALQRLYNSISNYMIHDTIPSQGCSVCKKGFDTPIPTSTLLCGHTFHTSCLISYITSRYNRCPNDECNVHSWDLVTEFNNNANNIARTLRSTIVQTTVSNSAFQSDLKDLKRKIARVRKFMNISNNELSLARNTLIRKHLHNINAIQTDMNLYARDLNHTENAKFLHHSLKSYRKKAAEIFRKYHLSRRDLIDSRHLTRGPWRVNRVLELHRRTSRYDKWRIGLRMYPGKKVWRDPLV